MKKLVTLIAVSAFAISASADLTGWKWAGGASLTDQNGAAIANAGATVFTTPNMDLALAAAGGQIQLSAIQAVTLSFVSPSATPPFGPSAGTWGTSVNNAYDGSIVGQDAYALIVNRAGLTSLAEVVVGDYVGFSALGGQFVDLQPGTDPALVAQSFNGGDVQTATEVIPEPATLGLMGIAGLGMFLARKKARR
ncbi:PEP-CTERM sorting domain-containing protein [Pontiellaceae bacterium B1224]|nr:PEP-CTERM sorting domain-containing protein [Pontiellaceae bacterium B1224]